MKRIRIVALVISLTMLFTGAFNMQGVSASENNKTESEYKYLSEEEVIASLSYTFSDAKLQEAVSSRLVLSPEKIIIDSFNSEAFSEYTNNEFGGMYMDNDGVVVICFKRDSDSLKAAIDNYSKSSGELFDENKEMVAKKFIIKEVTYSESELKKAYEYLFLIADKYKTIKEFSIDNFNNRLIIGIADNTDMESIENELSIFNKDMYVFDILGKDFEVNPIATISGTSAINNGTSASTPAGRMYSSSRNEYGVITCGHGWAVGNSVYAGSTKISTIKYRQLNGTNDSSYFVLNSGHTYSDQKYDEFDSRVPVVGSSLTLRGFNSGRVSSKVQSVTASCSNSGYTWSNMIKCDKAMVPGDSGGGAIGGLIDGGRTAVIVAINQSVSSTSTYLIRSKVILDAYR